jgi:PAS domain S-box-containing protein
VLATFTRAPKGTLLFLGNQKIAPVVYLEGSEPTGLAVDLVRAMAKHISQPVEVRAMDWKTAQAVVASGAADALIQINATPERLKLYDFSEPFLESHFSIFVRESQTGIKSVASLHGLRVGVEAGGLPQQLLSKDPEIELRVIPNFPEGFSAVRAGSLDAVVVDYRVGSYLLATNGITGIKAAGDPIATSFSAIAVRKGNTALLHQINAALDDIKADGTYDRILATWAPTEGVYETHAQINQRSYTLLIAVLVSLLVITVGWAVALRLEMSRKLRAEQALRASQKKLALHLEQTLLGVIEWDLEGRVRAWNPAAEQIFGYARNEAIGRRADELIVPSSHTFSAKGELSALLGNGGSEASTREATTKDGRTILCEWVNTLLKDEGGKVVGVMSLVSDITERHQAERLRVEKEAAEAASAAKSSFLANMSHEIRTPMNAILGFSQLMQRDKALTGHQRQQLDIINNSGEHLLALINDILEMSKIEAGRLLANMGAFDLGWMLDELERLFAERAAAKGLSLRFVRADDLPTSIVSDENKLRQIFLNLLGNAVKFTDAGMIEMRVNALRQDTGQLRLLVEVQDTGRGIAAGDRDKLFTYFEQAGSSHSTEPGTGLGLAICREFVELLGGTIDVISEPGKGSTFRFDVPVGEALAEAITPPAPRRRVIGLREDEPRYRVLVADDAKDNRELLVQLLEPLGFEVKCVANGREVLDAFKEWQPDIILMDMRMPVMDGYEATRLIRSSEGGGEAKILGVTASAFTDARQSVLDAGVDEFVAKPFDEADLFEKIGQALGARFVYDDGGGEDESQPAEPLETKLSVPLPHGLAQRIRQATKMADFEAVAELAEEVAQIDAHSADVLRALAERFDDKGILAALGEADALKLGVSPNNN